MIQHPDNPVRFYRFRPSTLVLWHHQDRMVDRMPFWWKLIEEAPMRAPTKKRTTSRDWRYRKAIRPR